MKIGIFTDTYKPQINGVVTSVLLMEQKLKEHGHEPYIFTVSHPALKLLASPEPANVYRIGSVPFWGNTDHRIAKLYSQHVMHIVKDLGIDIIHSHAPFSLGIMGHLIARWLRIPEVHTYHTMLSDYTYYVKFGRFLPKEVAENYSRVFCNNVNAVVVPTEKVYEALKRYGVKKPMYVIPTGIDLPHFSIKLPAEKIDALKTRIGLNKSDKKLVFVGRIAREKSIDKLINFHKKLVEQDPSFKLLIVGEGAPLGELKMQSKALSLESHVLFTGKVNYTDLPAYYQVADCFVTASTSETQGLVVLEAAASRLPIIAIKDDSYTSIVKENENGFYFKTEEDYIKAVQKLFGNDTQLKNMGEKSHKLADSFSSENFYRKLMEVYETTIEQYKK